MPIEIGKLIFAVGGDDREFRRLLNESEKFSREKAKRLSTAFNMAVEGERKAYASGVQARINLARKATDAIIREIKRETDAHNQRNQLMNGGRSGGFGGGSGGMLDVFGGNLASQVVSRLTAILAEGSHAVLKFSSNLEQTKIGFQTLMGGATQAQAHLGELMQFSMTTPFEFEFLAGASRKLQGVGIEGKRIIPILTDIGNAAAAAGASSEQLGLITRAVSQIAAKGRLMAEEVNQMAEHGIPAWRILATTMGKTQAEVVKMTEAGKISSELFLAALHEYSAANFGDAMQKQSKTFAGAMSNVKDTLQITAADAFKPWYDEMSKTAVSISEAIQGKNLSQTIEIVALELGQGFGRAFASGVTGAFEQEDWGALIRANINLGAGASQGMFGKDWQGLLPGLLGSVTGEGGFYKGDDRGMFNFTNSDAVQNKQYFAGSKKEQEDLRKTLNDVTGINQELDKLKQKVEVTPEIKRLMNESEQNAAIQSVNKTIGDLSNKIEFFGEKTQEATVRQQFAKEGVNEWAAAEVQLAIGLAKRLDEMTAAAKATETYRNITEDLMLKIRYFGDETQTAATEQQLLKQGILDLNTAQAQSVLTMARRLDALKEEKKAADEYNEKLKNLRTELTDMREQAFFENLMPNATPLQKFDYWVRRNAKGFGALDEEIKAAREELQLFAGMNFQTGGYEFASKAVSDLTKQYRDLQLEVSEVSAEERDLIKIAERLGVTLGERGVTLGADEIMREMDTVQTFAAKMLSFYNQLDAARQKQAAGQKNDDWVAFSDGSREIIVLEQAIDDYLNTLQRFDEKGGTIEIFAHIREKFGTKAAEQIFKIIGAQKESRKLAGDKTYNKTLEELNELMMVGVTESERYRISKQLETDAYKNLNDEQKKNLLLKAEEVDGYLKSAQYAIDTERQRLSDQMVESQHLIAAVSATAAERYKLAWTDALNEVYMADVEARESIIRSQVLIADKFTIHHDQIRSKILEMLSGEAGLTELVSNAATNSMGGAFDALNRGIDGFIGKIGLADTAFGDLIGSILKDLARLAISKVFQMIFGAVLGGFNVGGAAGLTDSPIPNFGGGGGPTFAASGGWFAAAPGGQNVQLAEAGYPEVVLSTDPKHRARSESLLSTYTNQTNIVPRHNYRSGDGAAGNTMVVNNHFHADKQTGAFSPQSAQQAAQRTSLHLARVNRRNS